MFNRNPYHLARAIIGATVASMLSPLSGYAPALRPVGRRRNPVQPPAPAPRHTYPPMTQARERRYTAEARRVRQIERGQLTISNGLVVPGLRYLGHGLAMNDQGKTVCVGWRVPVGF